MTGTERKRTGSAVAIPAAGDPEKPLSVRLVRSREMLARSIARNNHQFRSSGIETATNRILFPLLLLAAAEERGLLPAGSLARLRDCVDESGIPVLPGQFADELYADVRTADSAADHPGAPVLDAGVIGQVLADFVPADPPARAGGMSAELLGQVLTQYLARTIRRPAAGRAEVTDAPDAILSGGTIAPHPAIIAVTSRQAFDEARKIRSRRELLPLRVIDPACGSGAVLAAAYRHLLETAAEPHLTFEERQEILSRSIHGVDLSPHAVAATRLLLLLELFAASPACSDPEDFLARSRPALQDLKRNILCGNALVGPEIARDESWTFASPRHRTELNPFAWGDHFPEVRAAGWFDLVLCNPPEGPIGKHEWIQQYFQQHFSVYHRSADRSAYYVETGFRILRPGGTLAFIMQSRWLRAAGGSPLRALMKDRPILAITEYSGAGLCSILVRNTGRTGPFIFSRADLRKSADPGGAVSVSERFPVDPSALGTGGWTFADTRAETILRKMEAHGTRLRNFCMGEMGCGALERVDPRLCLGPGERERLIQKDRRSVRFIRPFLAGAEIGRYHAGGAGRSYLLIAPGARGSLSPDELRKQNPHIARLLKRINPGVVAPGEEDMPWYVSPCRDTFVSRDVPKILFPCRSPAPVFTFDDGRSLISSSAGYLVTPGLYLLAVLNSSAARFWFLHRHPPADDRGYMDTGATAAGLFVPVPDFDVPHETEHHDRLEALVRRMLTYHDQLPRARTEAERENLRKKIEKTDRRIDALVYELYGLTPDEIAVVGGNPSQSRS